MQSDKIWCGILCYTKFIQSKKRWLGELVKT